MTKITFRRIDYDPDYEVEPHAIFSRPLRWFTLRFRRSFDNLDQYEGVSYAIGNEVTFDLRTYKGHPKMTVSLYLSIRIRDQNEILKIIKIVIEGMMIPETAVAWRRGQEFEYGQLLRNPGDRLWEREARVIVLKIAASQPNRRATTTFLKREIINWFDMSPADMQVSKSRPNKRVYQQVVGNVISHQKSPTGLFVQGLAKRTQDGLQVTKKGMDYLNSLGFETASASS